jgi:hypothetical protein
MQSTVFAWDVPAEFNFGRDVVDALGREERRGLLFVDAVGGRDLAPLGGRAARPRHR